MTNPDREAANGPAANRPLAMIDWLHELPFIWVVVVVFGAVYLAAAAISWAVRSLAVGDRALAFKALSPGMLPPLGIVFGLLVAFLAAQVWSDVGQAQAAVDREASALRAAVLLSARFPGEPEARVRSLVRRHIETALNEEWPAMARQHQTIAAVPVSLGKALEVTLALTPGSEGQKVAQREMVGSFETALDARRQRILVSESRITWAKWTGVGLLAGLTLLAIAFVHSDNRVTLALAMSIFASAVAVCFLVLGSEDRPFAGPFAVQSDALVQVMPVTR